MSGHDAGHAGDTDHAAAEHYANAEQCADAIIDRLCGHVRLALPLGLGKPVRLVNALYRRAKRQPAVQLQIYTALSLEIPRARSGLEERLLGPLVERIYAGVPELEYTADVRRGALPANVQVEEFFLRPGAYLGVTGSQQNYVSLNYTQAARHLAARGVNVIAQMVAPGDSSPGDGRRYSLSCNPDVTLDLLDAVSGRDPGTRPLLVGEVNGELPFMPGDAELAGSDFDLLLAAEETRYPLFAVPNRPVPLAEHAIALRVAGLIRDGGTLQVGIGSVGDAVAYALGLRRLDNGRFRSLVAALRACSGAADAAPELDDLPNGVYGASEMFVEGLLYLHDCGVLRRTVEDGVFLHAGFFLGSAGFYQRLRGLPEGVRQGIGMTRISFTNSLLGDEARKRRQRRDARFVNSAMMVTLLGAAVSDGLEDGRVVSGVGGQHDFVTMAHQLDGARSILVLPATRRANGRVSSNIVWRYGHVTIPRHLRDLVVTEYGVADLRGASDADVIAALLNVTDSRFQAGLREQAVAAGKLPRAYRIPERCRSNYPRVLADALRLPELSGALPFYPIGSDFTKVEAELTAALSELAEHRGVRALVRRAWSGWRAPDDPRLRPALQRMGLEAARGPRERFYRALLVHALRRIHHSGRPLFAPDAAPVP